MAGDLDWNGFIKDNANEFVDVAVTLYKDKKIWERSQEKGFDIIENRFKKSHFEYDCITKINSLSENLLQHRNNNFIGAILQHHSLSSTKYMSKWIEEKNRK